MTYTNDKDRLPGIFKEAISIEIYGKEYYSIFSDLVEDENAKSVFRGLSRDEGEHRELLEKEYRKVSGKPFDSREVDETNRAKAKEIFPESLEPMSIEETKDILQLGIRTEDRSIELYSRSAKENIDQSSKELFQKLVVFEREHRKLLEDSLFYLEQEGSWYGYSPPTIEG